VPCGNSHLWDEVAELSQLQEEEGAWQKTGQSTPKVLPSCQDKWQAQNVGPKTDPAWFLSEERPERVACPEPKGGAVLWEPSGGAMGEGR
jgi:hypothetical protein